MKKIIILLIVFIFSIFNSACSNSNTDISKYNNLQKLNSDINIGNLGVEGDGLSHKIKDVFPNVTLSEVRALNPNATLDNEANWYIIQKTINQLNFYKGGLIYFPSGKYVVDLPIIINKHNVILQGVESRQNDSGTVIVNVTDSKQPVIKCYTEVNDNNYREGIKLENMQIQGKISSSNIKVGTDRDCLYISKAYKLDLENVTIKNFKGSAVIAEHLYDSIWTNLEILYCGTEKKKPALDMRGIDEITYSNTNAIKIYGLHMEHCPYLLHMKEVKNIMFTDCKFEIGNNAYPSNVNYNPIFIESGALEVKFNGCMFVYKNAPSDTDGTRTPFFFNIANNYTIINSCMFSSVDDILGTKWINFTGQSLILSENTFLACIPTTAFYFDSGATINGNVFVVNQLNGKRNFIKIKDNNIIIGNVIKNSEALSQITQGDIFEILGHKNTVKDNKIIGSYYNLFNFNYKDNILENNDNSTMTLTDNNPQPKINGSELITISNTLPTIITNFSNVTDGQMFTILFTNGNTTIKGGSGIILKNNSANINPQSGQSISFIGDNGQIYEVNRNF